MGVSLEMARLIVPCKGSSLVKTRFLGMFSSFNFQLTPRSLSSHLPIKSCSKGVHSSSHLNIRKADAHLRRSLVPSSSPSVKLVSKRLICSVATKPQPSQIEEPEMDTPKEIFLKDYKMPDYLFDTVDLRFQLGEDKTIVSSKIAVLPRVEGISCPLVLHGRDLKLLSVKLDGKELKGEEYKLDSRYLTLTSPPSSAFTLEIIAEIYPQNNTSLEGLYKTSGNFCTQCEVEGFRKITSFIGFNTRPLVISVQLQVYEKGAEVVRMYKTLLGSSGFRKGMDLYFQRHDRQAVTCEDFYAAMRDANSADFSNFLLWYSQAGTPSVKVTTSYDPNAWTFTLKFRFIRGGEEKHFGR